MIPRSTLLRHYGRGHQGVQGGAHLGACVSRGSAPGIDAIDGAVPLVGAHVNAVLATDEDDVQAQGCVLVLGSRRPGALCKVFDRERAQDLPGGLRGHAESGCAGIGALGVELDTTRHELPHKLGVRIGDCCEAGGLIP